MIVLYLHTFVHIFLRHNLETMTLKPLFSILTGLILVASLSAHTDAESNVDDTQAPTPPATIIVSNVTQTSMDLAWSPSTDNVGVVGYNIYNNSDLIKTVDHLSLTTRLNGLPSFTIYRISISAFDAAGNESDLQFGGLRLSLIHI